MHQLLSLYLLYRVVCSADVFGGANGIPKRIPSPALCEPDTTAKNVLEKKSRTSNVDGADATPSARMRPGPAKNGR